ncbi:MAG: DUF3987 domain-containing protein [Desulfarculus sp.]|nr:DUF3987 domain-containing protein [Desulfarculus sp.]
MEALEGAFRQEVEAAGLRPPEIIADGQLHRCPVDGKPRGQDGAYVLHLDAPASGWWQNFRTGQQGTWSAGGDDRAMTPDERRALAQRMEATRREREAAQAQAWAESAQRAQTMLGQAQPCQEHAYLEAKKVKPCPGLKLDSEGRLLVPVLGPDGKAQSLQTISPDSEKRFMPGGRMTGGYFAIKGGAGPLLVCEGLATGLSLHEATGFTVLCAFSAGNLEVVATMARGRYPERTIVLAGDDDHATPGNPGRAKATASALAVGGKLALPVFAQPGVGTDFNDLAQTEGLEMVRRQMEAAQAPEPAPGVAPTGQAQDWPDLVPFDSCQPAPLPVDTLPGWAKDFTLAAAEHLQVAPDLVLANVLGVVSTACAGKLVVEVKPGYREPVNLYILAPAPPAERKSAAQALAVAPLLAWESEKAQAMRDNITAKASERKSQEAIIAGLRGRLAKAKPDERQELIQEIADLEAALPEVPRAPRLLADDLTPEAMGALMAEHSERLGIISAEGGLFDTLAGRYSNGVANLDLVLKAHAGDSVRVDRRHAPPVVMQAPALTLCLSPQPEVMQGLMDKPGFRGRGLLGRFVYILPQSLLGHRTIDAPPITASVQTAYHAAVHKLLGLPQASNGDADTAPHVLHLSDYARQEWKAFASGVEEELRDGGNFEHVRDWAGKLPGLAARLAGLLHCMEHQAMASGRPISQATMAAALDLAAGLVGHALAAFRIMGADPDLEAAKHALAWIRRERVEHFTMRDCHRAMRGRYPRAAQVQAALGVLEERAFIFSKEPAAKGGPGRPASPSYAINPKALEG